MTLMISFPEGGLELLEDSKPCRAGEKLFIVDWSPAHFDLRDWFSLDKPKANDPSHPNPDPNRRSNTSETPRRR
ncbi:MAG: hypothetical protein KDJ54_04725 [Candidatus Competibacteraceae bacterium]|nr:hypothetical protein [Candidatus Competibacteraceae bacterium]